MFRLNGLNFHFTNALHLFQALIIIMIISKATLTGVNNVLVIIYVVLSSAKLQSLKAKAEPRCHDLGAHIDRTESQ